jgi:hypothetical protein
MAVKKTKAIEKKIEGVGEKSPASPKATLGVNRWMTASWMILLIGGLSHMMPTQMAPILNYAVYGVTVQMVVGILSVVAALYYLLEE